MYNSPPSNKIHKTITMASSSSIHFIAAAFIIVLTLAPVSVTGLACSDVVKYVRPCMGYLKGSRAGTTPPAACCAGLKGLYSAAATVESRQTACNCFKSVTRKLNPKSELLQSLPGNCGVSSMPFVSSPNVDCSKIST